MIEEKMLGDLIYGKWYVIQEGLSLGYAEDYLLLKREVNSTTMARVHLRSDGNYDLVSEGFKMDNNGLDGNLENIQKEISRRISEKDYELLDVNKDVLEQLKAIDGKQLMEMEVKAS